MVKFFFIDDNYERKENKNSKNYPDLAIGSKFCDCAKQSPGWHPLQKIMRIVQCSDNGNVAAANKNGLTSHRNTDNRSWHILNNTTELQNTDISHDSHNFNCNNIYNLINNKDITDAKTLPSPEELRHTSDVTVETGVCNRQYRINNQSNKFRSSNKKSKIAKVDGNQENISKDCESFAVPTNVYTDTTPVEENQALEQSETDEMSENVLHPVPRGIVNPNYPGFQHLAHTLQDYSSNIEAFYQSENEMTDDDLEVDTVEESYQFEETKKDINFNNNNSVDFNKKENKSISDFKTKTKETPNDIPDLLKTISNNNNNETTSYDCSCTDIENNFHTKDIIGDFNKEIEDEIKQLLNYNINIQDDLEELRKDIKDTFAKPIENTINNISDVVNHVIKKLVETQYDSGENNDHYVTSAINNKQETEELSDINKDNETNTRTEMNLSRPTFLLIDNHPNNKIKDAILSDGKDDINIYENEYDTEALSHNVENTIKQLSTELRKIIPKLNEMRERDRMWKGNVKECSKLTDTNSNEINNLTDYSDLSKMSNPLCHINNIRHNQQEFYSTNKFRKNSTFQSVQRPLDDRHAASAIKSPDPKNATSVRKHDSAKEYDLGSFDVYNIETALPKIDLDVIENHLKAAKEAERRIFAKNIRLISIKKMFEGFICNIKRKFSKISDEISDVEVEKTGYKRRLNIFQKKFNKIDKNATLENNYFDDPILSPRALGSAECAKTEIAWPIITDSNPNILDKFTKIITITDKKRNDREEIRKRLAMGADNDEYYSLGHTDRPGKKPSLHSRLQNGKNLQICFMNETASDNEYQASDIEKTSNCNKSISRSSTLDNNGCNHPYQTRPLSVNILKNEKSSIVQCVPKLRPSSFTLKTSKSFSTQSLNQIDVKETDFYTLQAKLQTEARIALAQAKELAHIQMERERRSRAVSPVTEMLRRSMEKANAPLAPDRRRVSRQLLTDMNIAQLQVIVNELHSQIETLNDTLVKLLMARDELHMGQDSMLVDIEDLTRYLGVKEQTKKTKGTSTKSGVRRLTSLVHK
ncbi:unnamed protein product [Parnassius apollo]|uniref:(apollo) hypothetical protein n=1 Tax=Parnassius apollo TaxID=110799 RepID=A0A8S3X2S6_PARAO|nr:unnamed protein product [Parnassius apollo]